MRELNNWFLQNKRDFPWRKNRTPYMVWISEVMLQQTRANVVIPYFEKWLTLFPDVQSLAEAKEEEVIKAWEGLGYYSRARNLHKAAKQIVREFHGLIPKTKKALFSICGIGPYTANAILSFAFQQRAAAVDANVTRVLARFFCVQEDISQSFIKEKIQQGADALLDSEEPWITAEALIELGATICTLKPNCMKCPLSKNCLGKAQAEYLPIKKGKIPTTVLKRIVAFIEYDNQVLIKKVEPGKVMAGLYELPFVEIEEELYSFKEIQDLIESHLKIPLDIVEKLKIVTHTFTKFKAHLFPYRLKAKQNPFIEGYQWVEKRDLKKFPFSSGHRRIIHA